jgi:hypothetical protein
MMRRLLLAAVAVAPFSVVFAGGAVAAPGDPQPFTLAGAPSPGVAPGGSAVIDLTVTNPNDVELTLTGLAATISSITPAPGAIGPCTPADFSLTPLPSAVDVALPPNSSQTLSALGVAAADLPRFTMLNTTQNQDGCKSAVVTLTYAGTATAPGVGGVDLPPVEVPGSGQSGPQGVGGDPDPTDVGGVDLPGTGGSGHTGDLVAIGAALTALGAGAVTATARRRRRGI